MNQTERYNKITEIISKFKNGEELYRRNAVFNKTVHMMVDGMDIYDVFEQVILSAEQTQIMFEDYIRRDSRPFDIKK